MQTPCTICYDDLSSETSMTTFCGHDFHNDCINRWIDQDKSTCPLCRASIISGPEDLEFSDEDLELQKILFEIDDILIEIMRLRLLRPKNVPWIRYKTRRITHLYENMDYLFRYLQDILD
jgi:hypothetical protein